MSDEGGRFPFVFFHVQTHNFFTDMVFESYYFFFIETSEVVLSFNKLKILHLLINFTL